LTAAVSLRDFNTGFGCAGFPSNLTSDAERAGLDGFAAVGRNGFTGFSVAADREGLVPDRVGLAAVRAVREGFWTLFSLSHAGLLSDVKFGLNDFRVDVTDADTRLVVETGRSLRKAVTGGCRVFDDSCSALRLSLTNRPMLLFDGVFILPILN
jgi:hypothetical protein